MTTPVSGTDVGGGAGRLADEQVRVRLGETVVALDALRAHPDRFVRLYERVRATGGHVECLCTNPPEKLVIRARSGRFHVACWPGSRDRHTAHCHFHQLPAHLSGQSGHDGGISEDIDGVQIRLAVPLTLHNQTAAQPPVAPVPVAAGATGGAGRVTLLGLLHWLWERSQLNTWPGGAQRRRWADCVTRLTAAVDEVELDGSPLTRVLRVVPPYTAEHAAIFDRFTARLGRHGPAVRHGLLLGEIKMLETSTYGWRLKLRHLATPAYLDDRLMHRLDRSYPAVFAATRPEHARQVVLLVVDRTPRGHLRVIDAAAMLASTDYLPAESSHEVAMAEHLAAAGRRFVKPLRYDHQDVVFPDFVLTDVRPRVYVEVWGVSGRRLYEARRRVKRAYYQHTSQVGLLEWDVGAPLPPVGREPAASAPREPDSGTPAT
jgi:hypothetical protein